MTNPKILDQLPNKKIDYLKADANYTVLHLHSGEQLVSAYSLKVFTILFASDSFIRVDRSYLVNTSFISGASRWEKGLYVRLKNNTELLVPRRRTTALLAKYPNITTSTFDAR
jgi:two-component system LytT family response regulator